MPSLSRLQPINLRHASLHVYSSIWWLAASVLHFPLQEHHRVFERDIFGRDIFIVLEETAEWIDFNSRSLNSRFDIPRYISIYGALHFIGMHRHVFEVIFFSSYSIKEKDEKKKFLIKLMIRSDYHPIYLIVNN